MHDAQRIIAVDVGNSRVKLGLFESSSDCRTAAQAAPLPIASSALPEPVETLTVEFETLPSVAQSEVLQSWACPDTNTIALVASVHQQGGAAMMKLLTGLGLNSVRMLDAQQLPLAVHVDHPEKVGIDRLLAAVAVNRLRRQGTPAICVDLGTAITVDLLSEQGDFEGGAILPGIRTSAKALHDQTDALPDLPMFELDQSPDAVGKDTTQAISAGLFWGAVGAIREIVARQRDRLVKPPQLFVTGGAAPSVARLLNSADCSVRYVPHLVLAGVAIAAESLTNPGE